MQSSSRAVATQRASSSPCDVLARRVARVAQQDRAEAAAGDLAPQVVGAEGVAVLALEQDRDGGERLEDVEQLLVRRVVGQEVPEVDVPEAGRSARERRATRRPRRRRSRRCTARASRAGRARCRARRSPRAAPRCPATGAYSWSSTRDLDALHARRRARQFVGLGLPLAEVAPARVGGREAELLGLGRDVDDPGAGDGTESGVLVGHRPAKVTVDA